MKKEHSQSVSVQGYWLLLAVYYVHLRSLRMQLRMQMIETQMPENDGTWIMQVFIYARRYRAITSTHILSIGRTTILFIMI